MTKAEIIALDGYLSHVRQYFIAMHLANGKSLELAERMTNGVSDFMRDEIVSGRVRIKWVDGHVALKKSDVEWMIFKAEEQRARGDTT